MKNNTLYTSNNNNILHPLHTLTEANGLGGCRGCRGISAYIFTGKTAGCSPHCVKSGVGLDSLPRSGGMTCPFRRAGGAGLFLYRLPRAVLNK